MKILISEKGTYILSLHLAESILLTVGKLGEFEFLAGWYAYVGSAFGRGGLRGRLKHHLSPVEKPHWHIDYLRSAAIVREVWYCASDIIYEHAWADTLRSLPDAQILAPRFGSSDCKCKSHLIYLPQKPDFTMLGTRLGIKLHQYIVG